MRVRRWLTWGGLATGLLILSACGSRNLPDKSEYPFQFAMSLGGHGLRYASPHLCDSGAVPVKLLERGSGVLYPVPSMTQDTPSGYYLAFPVTLIQGQNVRVETTGDPSIDTVAGLFDGEVLIDWDDDGGAGHLSRLDFTVSRTASTYFVVVTTWPGFSGRVGVRILANELQGCYAPPDCDEGACADPGACGGDVCGEADSSFEREGNEDSADAAIESEPDTSGNP
jgi:hypothetical protein